MISFPSGVCDLMSVEDFYSSLVVMIYSGKNTGHLGWNEMKQMFFLIFHLLASLCLFDSVIPGIQKIWIRTWGCSHNNSDGEYMAGQLAAYGYTITGNKLDMV